MANTSYHFYPIWDPLLRALHWWNAVMVALQIVTGSIMLIFGEGIPDDMLKSLANIHGVSGYMFAAGLFARILWLFIGPATASWRDLLPLTSNQRKTITDTLHYYVSFLRGTPPLYKAHNSFAGIIYFLFFIIAVIQVVTGVIVLNMPEDLRENSPLLDWHEFGYALIILYIIAHVFAVFVHEFVERHNLISSMIHGSKTFTEEEWQKLAFVEKRGAGGIDNL